MAENTDEAGGVRLSDHLLFGDGSYRYAHLHVLHVFFGFFFYITRYIAKSIVELFDVT